MKTTETLKTHISIPHGLGEKSDDVVVSSAIVCFELREEKGTWDACQVSSLHPSNDYKTVRMNAHAKNMPWWYSIVFLSSLATSLCCPA
jgi:hypothetical protein